jgi:hypothetical protein
MSRKLLVFLTMLLSFFSSPTQAQTPPICKYGETLVVEKTKFPKFNGVVFECI